jgi:glycosyltransferase involved in cell wall biosynthesis
MPTRRSDPPQHAYPLGFGHRVLRGDSAHAEWEDRIANPDAIQLKGSVLSVVVAAKNEAPNLPELVDEIVQALRPLCQSAISELAKFEIVLVNDGSTDETQQVLLRLSSSYPELCWLTLATTAGQSAATVAGILAARGDWIATLDADLQNDPVDLVHLWNALPGHDAALGWRMVRHDVVSRRLISIWANRVRNAVLGQSIRDTGCSVRIFSRESALRLPLFQGMHRFIGPLLLRQGCRLIQVPVNHRPRASGRTHYNLWNRSLCVLIDLLGVLWLMRRSVRYRVISQRRSKIAVSNSHTENTVSADQRGYQGN